MLHSIYSEFGGLGALIAAVFIVGTTLSWFQAIAGIVISQLPVILKVVIVGLIALIPPLSLLVVGIFFLGSKSNVIRQKGRDVNRPNGLRSVAEQNSGVDSDERHETKQSQTAGRMQSEDRQRMDLMSGLTWSA